MNNLKVLELFAGIGACSKAFENLNIEHEIVDAVEIDKHAIASFNQIHNTNFEPQDIRTWNKDIQCDLIMHGSPCQDFSLAGKQLGGDKDSGTRSSLMYETLRIVEKLKPKYVIWENVKNLLSKRHVHNWDAYNEYMESLGYVTYCDVMNAKDYGIPQKRERVFTISILVEDGFLNKDYQTPTPIPLTKSIKDFLDLNESNYLTNQQLTYILDANDVALKSGRNINNRIVNPSIAKTISCRGASDQRADVSNFVVDYPNEIVTVGELKDLWLSGEDIKVRKLTPKECWRLMGFSDLDYEKASKVNSNTQLYKQAGNSIVVNVLEAILKNLLEVK